MFEYGYDADGMLTVVRYPNGVETHVRYDVRHNIDVMEHVRVADNTVLGRYDYTVDSANQRIGVTELNRTVTREK